MKTTPNLRLPYPEPADAPDGASQMQALAERVDTACGGYFAVSSAAPGTITPAGWGQVKMASVDASSGTWSIDDTGRLVVGQSGVYDVGMTLRCPVPNAPNIPYAVITTLNGNEGQTVQYVSKNAGDPQTNATTPLALAAGDKLGLFFATSSQPLTVAEAHLTASYVGPLPADGTASTRAREFAATYP